MSESTDWDQLDCYLAGELGERDAVTIRRWLMAHPEHAQLLDRVNRELDDIKALGDVNSEDALISWQALQTRMMKDDERVSSKRLSVRGRRGIAGHDVAVRSLLAGRNFKPQSLRQDVRTILIGLTAGIALLLVTELLGFTTIFHRIYTPPTTYTSYVTANGQRATIMLSDGNTVALNVASRLEVPTDYATGHHTVRLTAGEALFIVSHHTGNPLTVVAGATTTRVLGTSFIVRHYPTDSAVTVAVQEGKVTVDHTVVTPYHLVDVSTTGGVTVRSSDATAFTFVSGILTFNNIPLLHAIPDLDRWYDADIRLGDPILTTKLVKGKLPPGSLADLKTILEWTFDVRVVRDGRILTLYPNVP